MLINMAYSRRFRKRRFSRRSRSAWYDKRYSAKDVAIKALKNVNYIRGLVNSEMLHADNVFTLGANQSQIFSFVPIAQGDAVSGRTGNSILLRNLYVRGRLEINTSTTGNTRVTLALVKDQQQVSDTSPSISDIFVSSTDVDTLLNVSSAGRYKVIWRKTVVLTPVSGGRNAYDMHKYWKVYDHVRYNGTAASDIQKNGYYFVVITSEGVNYPTVVFNARAGYHDN